MESIISCKNRFIRRESFQLPQSNSWIPRYTLMREGIDKRESGGSPMHRQHQ
jgi:hypothetical protein